MYFCSLGPEEAMGRLPVLDDCCYDLIFYEGPGASLIYGPQGRSIGLPPIFTIHQLKPPYRLHFEGELRFFTIKFQPWANRSFFGELPHPGVIDLRSKHPEWNGRYRDFLAHDTLESKCYAVEKWLLGEQELGADALWIRQVCALIYKRRAGISVTQLSEQFSVSRQHLGKVFRKEVRYSLKHFILTLRMLELVKYRMKHPQCTLTETALQFGYFDQAHFIRDFRKFSGMTPSAFFRNPPAFLLRH
ncbi:helix-turn-helix transcriptional regulator [Robiginitalea sp. M366]|uniref:helix-turn-helix transcriptional regulator n=1 Tax=Robiginitalea aestuariiviva TaxID=3036903 RepID=UPI00240DA8C2|nr:helix-turn-helix transcriptional regulator [Robiginitalea aestuariiviva]MDG1572256.1 helix-turn-helix transcriptional regulator [Robiginitalea aestuariiviva]